MHEVIGLLKADKSAFPNLALMRLSRWHRSQGDSVELAVRYKKYDKLYVSKVFTFTALDLEGYWTKKIILGGSGLNTATKLPKAVERTPPDFSLYSCEHAYGFLTRGCTRSCPWCIVPAKEGTIHPYADIDDILQAYTSAILMDNNVLASDYGIKQLEKIRQKKIAVDFNQGLDSRLITKEIARVLAGIKWIRFLRFACDTHASIVPLQKAVNKLKEEGVKPYRIFVYALVQNDLEEAHARILEIKKLGADPFAMPYRDFLKNGETTQEARDFARWVNHKAIFKSVPWQEYKRGRSRA